MNSLQGKTVLITGGTDGIGRSLVLQYLSQGANVVTCGRTQQKIHALEAEAPIGKLCVLNLDIAIERDCERLVNHAIQQFGGIDVLINNVFQPIVTLRKFVCDIDVCPAPKSMN